MMTKRRAINESVAGGCLGRENACTYMEAKDLKWTFGSESKPTAFRKTRETSRIELGCLG